MCRFTIKKFIIFNPKTRGQRGGVKKYEKKTRATQFHLYNPPVRHFFFFLLKNTHIKKTSHPFAVNLRSSSSRTMNVVVQAQAFFFLSSHAPIVLLLVIFCWDSIFIYFFFPVLRKQCYCTLPQFCPKLYVWILLFLLLLLLPLYSLPSYSQTATIRITSIRSGMSSILLLLWYPKYNNITLYASKLNYFYVRSYLCYMQYNNHVLDLQYFFVFYELYTSIFIVFRRIFLSIILL